MRVASLWGAVIGVEKTVVEDVEFDEERGVIVVSVRPAARGTGSVWGVPTAGSRVMTRALVDAVGGRWMWARWSPSLRRTRRG